MTRCRSQHLHPVWGLDYKYVQKLPSSSHDTLLLPSLNVLDDLWLEQSKCWGTTKTLVKILYLMVYVSVCRACIPTWDPLSKHMASEQSGSGRPLPWRSAGMTSLPDFCSSPPSYSPDSPSSCWLIELIWATVRKTLWGGGWGWGLIFWVWITWGFTSDELWELLEHQQRDFLHQVFLFLFQPLVKVVFLHLIKSFFLFFLPPPPPRPNSLMSELYINTNMDEWSCSGWCNWTFPYDSEGIAVILCVYWSLVNKEFVD